MIGAPVKTSADSMQVFRRLIGLLRPWYGQIGVGVLLLIASSPCELFPAIVWMYVTDTILLGTHSSAVHVPWYKLERWLTLLDRWFTFDGAITSKYWLVVSAAAWMFVVYLLGEAFGTLETNLLSRVAQKFILGFRNTVYAKLQSQSLGYLQRQRVGDLMSRAMGDVDELQSFIVGSIDVILSEGLLWILTVIIAMTVDWHVACAGLAPLAFVYVMLRIFNTKVKPIYAAARERLGDVSTRLQENLSGLVVIKIFSREKQEAERFHDATQNYYDRQIDAINARSLFFPFSRAVGFLSNVGMLAVGGIRILQGSFTIGGFILFRAYWWRLFGPVQTLARVNDMIQRASAAGRRVFEILDAPDEMPDAPGAQVVEKVDGHMQLQSVTFRYPIEFGAKISPDVLRNVTLEIRPGETVALCGPSGSGKSTVLNLLLRFYDPAEGIVTLDGRDLRMIERHSLRSHFALVQQETFLFNDTILDNIRYGHAEATMDQVIAAAKAANAHAFITKLPNGYDTKVGERGVRLSGGQKQRISIARAFLANPSVLLLDEPTSSVEPDSEATIVAALDRLMVGRTTILTSHRPSLIMSADRVYVIEDGRVTQEGPPSELTGGWFEKFLRSADDIADPTQSAANQ
jgi:ABC-type multidrug transport system fused ATPase/permease subunit